MYYYNIGTLARQRGDIRSKIVEIRIACVIKFKGLIHAIACTCAHTHTHTHTRTCTHTYTHTQRCTQTYTQMHTHTHANTHTHTHTHINAQVYISYKWNYWRVENLAIC